MKRTGESNDTKDRPFFYGSRPGPKQFLQEISLAVLLGIGLGFIFNDLLSGLILGIVYGLANCFFQKGA